MTSYERLLAATVNVGHGREFPLIELMDGWAGHVGRLWKEAHEDAPEDAWDINDFVAALYLRTYVERGLAQEELVTPALLGATDELFRIFTKPDARHILAEVEPSSPLDGWWWRRIPRIGGIAAALGSTSSE